MRKPEQRLADRVRRNIGHRVLIERVENVVGIGMPDALILANKRVTWAEHKVADWPQRMSRRIQFKHPPTIEQRNWHMRWTRKGGQSLFLIGMLEGKYGPPLLCAVPGRMYDEVNEINATEILDWQVTYDELVTIYQRGFRK